MFIITFFTFERISPGSISTFEHSTKTGQPHLPRLPLDEKALFLIVLIIFSLFSHRAMIEREKDGTCPKNKEVLAILKEGKQMSLKDRLVLVDGSMAAALLIGLFSWVNTALAAGGLGDGDGPDADQGAWPLLIVGGLVLIGLIAFFVLKARVRAQSSHR
jgi:hypothetical protein